MIYLIGGPPRCGKSTLARNILETRLVSYTSTDNLVHMLKKAAPELGITDKIGMEIRVKRFFPFLEQFVKLVSYDPNGYTVEGDIIWPEQITTLAKKYDLKSVFLGFESITLEDIVNNIGSNDWIMDIGEKERQEMPKWLKEMSLKFKDECKKYNCKYIDLSNDFTGKLEEARKYLLS